MVRWVVLVALVGCEAEPPREAPPPPHWVYPPAVVMPSGVVRGRIGRSEAPQQSAPLGITGAPAIPLHLPTPWAVPGKGPARAIVYGLEHERPAIELIEIDQGRVVWRDVANCRGPVVGITSEVVVCADAQGTRAVGLDGKPRWHSDAAFIAMTDDRIVVGAVGESVILDAATGDETSRVALPAGVLASTIEASCGDAGRELFALGANGRLARIAEAKGGAKALWATPLGAILAVDACTGDTILVTEIGPAGTALVAIARATGAITGRVDGIRGSWPARDGSDRVEVATASGVTSWSRDLRDARGLDLPPLGELIATRGDRRLVRATPSTAVLLEPAGIRAFVPLASMGAALGDTALIAATWLGSAGETVHRRAIPPATHRKLRLPPRAPGTAVAAELRDLPAVQPLDDSAAIASTAGMHAVGALALDPAEPTAIYAAPLEREPDDDTSAAVARADLATRTWRWVRRDGCGQGTPIGLAVGREVIVCAARGKLASVRATALDGAPRWQWTADTADAIAAAGDAVLVIDADRATVLVGGAPIATLAGDDGGPVRAALLARGPATWLVSYERGQLVARDVVGMVVQWALAVDGVVVGVSASGDGVLVELENGDAARVDATTATVLPMPGLGLTWGASGELVTGATKGGPIYAPLPPPVPVMLPRNLRPPPDPEAAPLSTPIAPPASLGDSWELTLYELRGGPRTRNDYALAAPVGQGARFSGAPLVVVDGHREALVIDPRHGDPLRRVKLPEDAVPGAVFGSFVDGAPVAGALLARPLRIVLF